MRIGKSQMSRVISALVQKSGLGIFPAATAESEENSLDGSILYDCVAERGIQGQQQLRDSLIVAACA
jgi:hypothetical protein